MYNTCNKVLLASLVMLFLVLGFAIKANAQDKPIADETFMKRLKSSVKVETCNERIFSLLLTEFSGIVTKYTVSLKSDRSGAYKEYSVPFKLEYEEKLNQFFIKINKSK
jgi:hypothetical protein